MAKFVLTVPETHANDTTDTITYRPVGTLTQSRYFGSDEMFLWLDFDTPIVGTEFVAFEECSKHTAEWWPDLKKQNPDQDKSIPSSEKSHSSTP